MYGRIVLAGPLLTHALSASALVGRGRFRHSGRMTRRGWQSLVMGVSLLTSVACGSSDMAERSSGDSGGIRGGQTGSLKPCQVPGEFEAGALVPEGDAAFVFHSGCPVAEDFTLTDGNGESVPFQIETIDDGVVLLRTEDALTEGNYRVTTPDGAEQTVSVTEARPLPSSLGSLARVQQCPPLFELQLDTSLLPYLPLLQLKYTLNGAEPQPWFEYGTVMPVDGSVFLAPVGLGEGAYQLAIEGAIAGESIVLTSSTLDFEVACPSGENCAVVSPAVRSQGSTGVLFALAGLGFAALRRRRVAAPLDHAARSRQRVTRRRS